MIIGFLVCFWIGEGFQFCVTGSNIQFSGSAYQFLGCYNSFCYPRDSIWSGCHAISYAVNMGAGSTKQNRWAASQVMAFPIQVTGIIDQFIASSEWGIAFADRERAAACRVKASTVQNQAFINKVEGNMVHAEGTIV